MEKRYNLTDKTVGAFIALLKAGLWETDVQLSPYGEIDFPAIQKLAEEQSVVGLVAAGMEHVSDTKIPKQALLQFIGTTLQIEDCNKAMNYFIGVLVDKMRDAGIYTLLVKGQGVAQCYERPLWRSSGDVDFLLDGQDYRKAIDFLLPLSCGNKPEERYSSHLGITIDPWYVEAHGSLRTGLSARVDKVVDEVHHDTFANGNVRAWRNGETDVFLPGVDNDVFFVFTHYIKHFYKEGMTLRQVCDWCRLLWKFKNDVDEELLIKRLKKAGLMDEWRAFATLAVEYLGMPEDAMPLLDKDRTWQNKAEQIMSFLLRGYSGRKVKDTYQLSKIFPWKTLKYSPSIFLNVNWLKIKERLLGV